MSAAGLSICRILAQYNDAKEVNAQLVLIDLKTGKGEKVEIPSAFVGSLSAVETESGFVLAAVAGSPTSPSFVTALVLKSVSDLPSSKKDQWQVLKKASTEAVGSCALKL